MTKHNSKARKPSRNSLLELAEAWNERAVVLQDEATAVKPDDSYKLGMRMALFSCAQDLRELL